VGVHIDEDEDRDPARTRRAARIPREIRSFFMGHTSRVR